MFNHPPAMILSSPIGKRRVLPFDPQDEVQQEQETSQLLIRSPPPLPHPYPSPRQQQQPQSLSASLNHLYHHGNHHHYQGSNNNNNNSNSNSSNKRPRYDLSWTPDNLCTHPCSPLTSIDLESVFNMSTFSLLSQEKRDELVSMLPEVDQTSPYPLSSPHHHLHDNQQYDYYNNNTTTLNNQFFTKSENPIFWNALSDWQSMLQQGHLTTLQQQNQTMAADQKLVDSPTPPLLPLSPSPPTTTNHSSTSHKSTTTSSTIKSLEVAGKDSSSCCSSSKDKFKDEAFESYWGELIDKERAHNVAGDSKNITLKDMCRKGLIREGDVIVYKRNFSACKVIVSKSMTVVKASGLSGISIKLDNEIFEDFETPTALETKILDHHGKVTKDKRPNGNAFKSIRLIRSGKDMGRLFDIRKDGFGVSSASSTNNSGEPSSYCAYS